MGGNGRQYKRGSPTGTASLTINKLGYAANIRRGLELFVVRLCSLETRLPIMCTLLRFSTL